MPGTTTDSIPYMLASEALATLDEYTLQLATRLQALEDMRQGREVTITPSAASTATTMRVNFDTPFTTAGTPKVVACLAEPVPAPGAASIWVTAIDSDGFTLGIIATNTTARDVKYMAMP
jgi:hypothetical protein